MASTTKQVLVIGDWFIDEYWFIAKHQSEISSHTGPAHFRIVSDPGDAVRDLCGAGLVARVLYELRPDPQPYSLAGIGIWSRNDNEVIRHYIHSQCLPGGKAGAAISALFQLTQQTCTGKVDFELNGLEGANTEATIRIIRTYKFSKDKFKMVNRIDWEPRQDVATSDARKVAVAGCLAKIQTPDVVILDDHIKGLTEANIVEVIEQAAGAGAGGPKWFVRTKDKRILSDLPFWLKTIKGSGRLELLAVGPDIASRRYPMERLFASPTSRHLLTRRSHELLSDLKSQSGAKNVVIASDLMELIILTYDDQCYCARSPADIEDIDLKKINWTTAFFACLVHQMLGGKWTAPVKTDVFSDAIKDTHKHCGVKIPKSVYFRCDMPLDREHEPQTAYRLANWEDIQTEWEQATTDLGLVGCAIGGKTPLCLQVWRAKTDLPGYIACIEQKRDAIGRIWRAIKCFKMQGSTERSLSILLEADPGVGKTFLAETLVKTVGCRLIHHDVTQMIHREELLDLFDSVATAQAEVDPDVPVMVFVDEINASLDASPVYGAFLSPLEGGFYMRRGTKFKLKPCIWMFAGTDITTNCGSTKPEKQPDFTSRLDVHEKIGYAQLGVSSTSAAIRLLEDEARLEQVYLGAEMIRQRFGDVTSASEDVLKAFHSLDPAQAPARRIRKLVLSLTNVQYGRVGNHNCMSNAWHDLLEEHYMTLRDAGEAQQTFAEVWANRNAKYISLDFG